MIRVIHIVSVEEYRPLVASNLKLAGAQFLLDAMEILCQVTARNYNRKHTRHFATCSQQDTGVPHTFMMEPSASLDIARDMRAKGLPFRCNPVHDGTLHSFCIVRPRTTGTVLNLCATVKTNNKTRNHCLTNSAMLIISSSVDSIRHALNPGIIFSNSRKMEYSCLFLQGNFVNQHVANLSQSTY